MYICIQAEKCKKKQQKKQHMLVKTEPMHTLETSDLVCNGGFGQLTHRVSQIQSSFCFGLHQLLSSLGGSSAALSCN